MKKLNRFQAITPVSAGTEVSFTGEVATSFVKRSLLRSDVSLRLLHICHAPYTMAQTTVVMLKKVSASVGVSQINSLL